MRFGKFLCFAIIIVPMQAQAGQCADWVARIVSLQGQAEIRVIKSGQPASWQAVANNVTFCREDVVRVGKNSRLTLALNNDTILRLDQNTTVTFSNIAPDAPTTLNLLEGVGHFISRVKRAFKVITPFVDAGIEGTEFVVAVHPQYAEVTVFEGRVAVSNGRGKLILEDGQAAIAEQGQAPVLKLRVKPRNAVHWALHYPAILQADEQLLAGLEPDSAQKTINSLKQLKTGDASAALGSVEILSGSALTAPLLSYRAALYLTVGRANNASLDLEKALSQSPRNANALALKAIIALQQNQIQEAGTLASEAETIDPSSAAAGLALSYTQQARFDINAAYQTINKAVTVNPQNDLLLSRQAELALMLGDTRQAVIVANHATAINPLQARAHTVLGFAYLARNKPAMARQAFAKAMKLDAADPQVRLGTGLVNIRQGKLAAGRRELEIAASLDPNNALIRSYLGKAYFSEQRNKVASSQYDMARSLDPNDPTPWLYSAISKQANNRPVEAMLDLQQSAQLNDNRAVYRSRFLLDQDQATRASDLGNIYRELGFERQALLQGWTSTEQNPLDHSGHKLLADAYSAAPRHEQARINEQFLFTMLKPVDNTPIRPELAEAGLGILEGTGPSSPGYGDYNTQFDADRDNVEISGSAGDNKTHSTQLLGWGKQDNVGYSTSLYRYATNGFRDNNDQEIKMFNQFVQAELNDQAAIQFEYKRLDIERGDLDLRATGLFTPSLRQAEKIDTYRVGYRHKLKPNSVILASLMYQDGDFGTSFDTSIPLPGKTDLAADTSNIIAELRHIQTHASYNATTGFGIRRLDGDQAITLSIPLPGFPQTFRSNTDVKFYNLYHYHYFKPQRNLVYTLGASFESYQDDEDSSFDENKFNPKLGVVWSPADSVTLRAAYFSSIQKRNLSSIAPEPSLEPTSIAGFNQFYYTEFPAGFSKRAGIGIDYRVTNTVALGFETVYAEHEPILRDLNPATLPPIAKSLDWTELNARAYMNWAINNQYTLSVEYQYEDYDRDDDINFTGTEAFTRLTTHRIPISLNYFNANGISAKAKASYIDQDGDYVDDQIIPGLSQISDTFWVLDAEISYKLKNQRGIVSLVGKNLADENFVFQDTDPANPRILPGRYALIRYQFRF